ncbi:MAG: hypothetical protein PHQ12_04710 [Chthoniobacteraceae bacterium]|nr:hypothetical protein [Chthoniobacteraceae bacterium]
MPRKIRSDSLYAQLTPEQRDLLFEWLLDEGLSYEAAALLCTEKFGLSPSHSALCGFLAQHGFAWRMDRAKQLADDKATSLPKDFDSKKKAALAQREFEKAFNDLSTQEVIALQRLDLDRQIARTQGEIELEKLKIARIKLQQKEEDQALAREKFETDVAEKLLDAALRSAAEKIATSDLSNAEKIAAMRKAAFADVDELQASGKVVIPE